MSTETAIRTDGLTKHYPGVAALTDLSLDVPAGSIYGRYRLPA
jgi:ABC-type multidrug transport system ATPase subunit